MNSRLPSRNVFPASDSHKSFFQSDFCAEVQVFATHEWLKYGFNLPPSNSVVFLELKAKNLMALFWMFKSKQYVEKVAKMRHNRVLIRSIKCLPRALCNF